MSTVFRAIDRNTDRDVSGDKAISLNDVTAEVRTFASYDGHEQVVVVVDEAAGLRAMIAIHDRTLGPALGGCRMWPYASDAEAITDVLRLSRGMTLKATMAGVAAGGGKAVILGDSRSDKSEALFRAFGRSLNAFGGRFYTGQDVGVSVGDIDWIARESPYALGGGARRIEPSPITAYGVYVGLKASVRRRLGRANLDGLVVAVQGLGKVGQALCTVLRESGARLFVTDIQSSLVSRVCELIDATPVSPDEIYDVPADVIAPCALGAVLNDESIRRLKCAVVAGSANNQLLDSRHGENLRRRGILYAPDYVINAGGLIAVSLGLTPEGFSTRRAKSMTRRIGDTLDEIFDRSEAEDAPPNVIADRIALERIARARRRIA